LFFRFTQNLEYGVLKRFNTKAKKKINPVLEVILLIMGVVFLTKNGNANISKEGVGFFESINL
jgi:hypothetical protein